MDLTIYNGQEGMADGEYAASFEPLGGEEALFELNLYIYDQKYNRKRVARAQFAVMDLKIVVDALISRTTRLTHDT